MRVHESLQSIKFIEDGEIKAVEIPIIVLNELTENILTNLAYSEPDVFDVLLLTAKKAQSEIPEKEYIGFSFDDIVELFREKNDEQDDEQLREKVEKSLDVLLDIGFFTPKWVPKEDGERVVFERRFLNRGEPTNMLAYRYMERQNILRVIEYMTRDLEKLLAVIPIAIETITTLPEIENFKKSILKTLQAIKTLPRSIDLKRLLSNIISVKSLIDSFRKEEIYDEIEHKELDLGEEIDSIIRESDYDKLYSLLEKDEEGTLEKLYEKIQDQELDLESHEGKQIFRNVFEFYEKKEQEEKVDSILSNLAEYSRTEFQQRAYDLAYDIVFSFWTGVTFNPEVGKQSANNVVNYLSKKKQEKLKGALL